MNAYTRDYQPSPVASPNGNGSDSDSFLPFEDQRNFADEVEETMPDDEPVYEVEDLDQQVQQAQSRLSKLRQEQEELQRRKEELEALNAKQNEFHNGRNDLEDKLTRSVTKMEKLIRESQRRVEAMEYAADTFRQHLQIIECLRPEEWKNDEMHEELSRALELLATAESDYLREMRRLEGFEEEAEAAFQNPGQTASRHRDFYYWLKAGFAFTLPVVVVGIIAVVLILTALGGS